MTSPQSSETIVAGHEVRFLVHESCNGLLKDSVEKEAFNNSAKKAKKQAKGASGLGPGANQPERIHGLADKMGEVVGLWDYVPDCYTGFH